MLKVKLYSGNQRWLTAKPGHKFRLQRKNVSPSEENQTVSPDENYDGLIEVNVGAAPLQTKSVSPSENDRSIAADSGYYGLERVDVAAARLQEKETKSDIIQINPFGGTAVPSAKEILPDADRYGLSKVKVKPVKLQSKVVYPEDSDRAITPDTGYDGLYKVSVRNARLVPLTVKSHIGSITAVYLPMRYNTYGFGTVNVEGINLQDKTVTPTEQQQIITADSGYDALGTVTVAAARLTPKIIRVD